MGLNLETRLPEKPGGFPSGGHVMTSLVQSKDFVGKTLIADLHFGSADPTDDRPYQWQNCFSFEVTYYQDYVFIVTSENMFDWTELLSCLGLNSRLFLVISWITFLLLSLTQKIELSVISNQIALIEQIMQKLNNFSLSEFD